MSVFENFGSLFNRRKQRAAMTESVSMTDRLASSWSKVRNKTGEWSNELQLSKASIAGIGQQLKEVTGVALRLATTAAPIVGAAAVESQLTGIRRISKVTGVELERVRVNAVQTGVALGANMDDLFEMQNILIKSGTRAKNELQSASAFGYKMTKVFDMSAGAAGGLTREFISLGFVSKDIGDLNSQFSHLGDLLLSANRLTWQGTDAIQQFSSMARDLQTVGQNIELFLTRANVQGRDLSRIKADNLKSIASNMLAMQAAISSQYGDVGRAQEVITNLFNGLTNPVMLDRLQTIAPVIGASIPKLRDLIKAGKGGDAMTLYLDRLSKFRPEELGGLAEALQIPADELMKLQRSFPAFVSNMKDMQKVNQSFDNMYRDMVSTFDGLISVATNLGKVLFQSIGAPLLWISKFIITPVFTKAIGGIVTLFEKMPFGDVILGATGLAAAFFSMGKIVKATFAILIKTRIGELALGWTNDLLTKFGLLSKLQQWLPSSATKLGAAFSALADSSLPLNKRLTTMWSRLRATNMSYLEMFKIIGKDVGMRALDTFQVALGALSWRFGKLMSVIKSAGKASVAWFAALPGQTKAITLAVGALIAVMSAPTIGQMFRTFSNWLDNLVDKLWEFPKELGHMIGDALSFPFTMMIDFFKGKGSNGAALDNAIIKFVNKIADGIIAAITMIPRMILDAAWKFGKNIIDAVREQGITGATASLGKGLVSGIIESFQNLEVGDLIKAPLFIAVGTLMAHKLGIGFLKALGSLFPVWGTKIADVVGNIFTKMGGGVMLKLSRSILSIAYKIGNVLSFGLLGKVVEKFKEYRARRFGIPTPEGIPPGGKSPGGGSTVPPSTTAKQSLVDRSLDKLRSVSTFLWSKIRSASVIFYNAVVRASNYLLTKIGLVKPGGGISPTPRKAQTRTTGTTTYSPSTRDRVRVAKERITTRPTPMARRPIKVGETKPVVEPKRTIMTGIKERITPTITKVQPTIKERIVTPVTTKIPVAKEKLQAVRTRMANSRVVKNIPIIKERIVQSPAGKNVTDALNKVSKSFTKSTTSVKTFAESVAQRRSMNKLTSTLSTISKMRPTRRPVSKSGPATGIMPTGAETGSSFVDNIISMLPFLMMGGRGAGKTASKAWQGVKSKVGSWFGKTPAVPPITPTPKATPKTSFRVPESRLRGAVAGTGGVGAAATAGAEAVGKTGILAKVSSTISGISKFIPKWVKGNALLAGIFGAMEMLPGALDLTFNKEQMTSTEIKDAKKGLVKSAGGILGGMGGAAAGAAAGAGIGAAFGGVGAIPGAIIGGIMGLLGGAGGYWAGDKIAGAAADKMYEPSTTPKVYTEDELRRMPNKIAEQKRQEQAGLMPTAVAEQQRQFVSMREIFVEMLNASNTQVDLNKAQLEALKKQGVEVKPVASNNKFTFAYPYGSYEVY